jgi:CAAX protease family protein
MTDAGKDDSHGGVPESEPHEDALWLTGDDFQDHGATVTDGWAIRPAEPNAARPPGPGLPESLAWMGGMFAVQLIGGVIAFVAVILLHLANTGGFGRTDGGPNAGISESTLKLVQQEYAGTLFGIIQTVTIIGAAVAVSLRFGRERRRLLPLAPIAWRHLAVIFAAVLPLIVLSSQLHIGASWVWERLTDLLPALKAVNDASSMAYVEKMAQRTSFLGLLFSVAVAPAVAEELVFRGAIGRGLIARWGLPAGVAITSLLFAAMHVHPPQVLALIPLAVFIHLAYVATRSFCAPMLVHFLNNAFAVVVLSLVIELPEPARQLDQSPRMSVLMLGCSAFCVAMLTLTLWRSRMQFVDGNGNDWTPGYPAVERPPAELPLSARCRPTELADWAPAAVGLGVFLLGMIVYGALALQGWQV